MPTTALPSPHSSAGSPDSPIPPSPKPSRPARVAALDILRGIAIIGTLATNIGIWVSADRIGNGFWGYFDTLWGLCTDGKYIGLLTIMFGIGLEIQRQAAVRKGEPWLGAYPWRAALLVLDGLLNYLFIFDFDVLMGYGLTGLTMCFVFATTERFQKWFLGFGIAVHLAYLTWMSKPWEWGALSSYEDFTDAEYALLDKAPNELTASQLAHVAKLTGQTVAEYKASYADMMSASKEVAHLGYWDYVTGRLENFWGGRGEIPIMFTMGLGMFLVGAMLYRNGIFEERGRKLRMWVMGLSFGIGLPVDWVTRLWFQEYTGTYNRYFTSACVSIGILALVAHFYASGRTPGRVGRWMSYVGKMALTCYLAQNLIAMILFAQYCLDLSRFWPQSWAPAESYVAFVVVSAILIAFSAMWLRYFERGPVEWAWHWSYDFITAHVPTRWEPRVRRADAERLKAQAEDLSSGRSEQPALEATLKS